MGDTTIIHFPCNFCYVQLIIYNQFLYPLNFIGNKPESNDYYNPNVDGKINARSARLELEDETTAEDAFKRARANWNSGKLFAETTWMENEEDSANRSGHRDLSYVFPLSPERLGNTEYTHQSSAHKPSSKYSNAFDRLYSRANDSRLRLERLRKEYEREELEKTEMSRFRLPSNSPFAIHARSRPSDNQKGQNFGERLYKSDLIWLKSVHKNTEVEKKKKDDKLKNEDTSHPYKPILATSPSMQADKKRWAGLVGGSGNIHEELYSLRDQRWKEFEGRKQQEEEFFKLGTNPVIPGNSLTHSHTHLFTHLLS